MAKYDVTKVVDELMVDLSPEAMTVKSGKGKKAKVDADATAQNMLTNLAYARGILDAFDAVSDQVDGLEDAIADYKADFNVLFDHANEEYADGVSAALENADITAFEIDGDEEGSDEDPFDIVAGLDDADAKKVAKELGVKVARKDSADAIADKLADEVDEDDLWDVLDELGFADGEADEDEDEEEPDDDDSDADEDDGDEDEGDDDEELDYADMSLSELRAECKERGIKYTPKQKEDALIEMLEADDEANGSDEDEEEPEEDEADGSEYDDMTLGELRKECKARGIKWTPKDKQDALIAKLVEDDEAGDADDDEDAEDDDEDVSEEELDEVLDEEFEDEVLEQEKKASRGGKSNDRRGRKN